MVRLIRSLFTLFVLFVSGVTWGADWQPDVTYLGEYNYNGSPAVIVQFDDVIPFKNAVTITKKADEVALPESKWVMNASKTALIYPDIEVGTNYQVTLNNGLIYEQESEHDVTVYEKDPSLEILGRGPIVPIFGKRTIPIVTTNVSKVSVEVLKVTDPASFLNKTHYSASPDRWVLNRLTKSTTPVTELSFDIAPSPTNHAQYSELELPKEFASGWYFLIVKSTGSFNYNSEKAIQVALTDIGIQAKVFPETLSVQVSSLSKTQAIENAEISILSRDGEQYELGSTTQGFGQFDYSVSQGDILMATHGDQVSYLPLREIPLDLSDFKVAGRSYQDLEVFAYSNRNLFRPGETLPLNLVLRDQDGNAVPDIDRLYVEYLKPDRSEVSDGWLTQQEATGFFQDHYDIPASAPLGTWVARIKTNPEAQESIADFFFSVSEFVPERMDLTVDLPEAIPSNAESATARLTGKYLFGSPTAQNRVAIDSHYRSVNYFDSQLRDFFVGQAFSIESWRDVPDIDDIELDDNGEYQLTFPLYNPELMESPVNAKFTFELFENGGASISRSQQRQLWTGQSLAGIKLPNAELNAYSSLPFELGLLDGKGENLIAGKLSYTLERNAGGYYWVYHESSGWEIHSDNEWRPVRSDLVTTEAGKTVPIQLDVEWGRYRLTVITEQGVVTRYPFWTGWEDSENNTQKPVKPDQLSISLDKKQYKIGDTVRVTLFSKQGGELQLSLDADYSILHQTHAIQAGEHQYEFVLEPELNQPDPYSLREESPTLNRHDLYLTATLVSTPESEGDSQGKQLPQRFFAVSPIILDRAERELTVSIEHPERLLPLEPAAIKIKLDEPTQAATWVTLSLMDRGIINLSKYKVPQIAPQFFAHRRYQADVIDLYSHFYQTRPDSFATPHRYGGDQEINLDINKDDLVESKTITFMSELVQFDSNGEATITVDIPDYNGQAQVVAMVFNDTQVGQAESNVTISAPVVAELAIPRFLTPGDISQTYLELFNTSGVSQTVRAEVSTDQLLSIQGKSVLEVTLADGERASLPVSFEVSSIDRALERTEIDLRVEAKGDDGSKYYQKRDWQLPIRIAQPLVSQHHLLTLTPLLEADDQSNTYQLKPDLWQDYQSFTEQVATINYSRSPQLNIVQYAQGLFRYPYGCAEQTTSKATPWLLNDSSLEPMKEKVLDGKTPEELIKQSVTRLATMQKSNGSFSLWSKHGETDEWLSMYVTDYLMAAERRFPRIVPSSMLKDARSYVRKLVDRGLYQPDDTEGFASSFFYAIWLGTKEGFVDNSDLYSARKVLTGSPKNSISRLSSAHFGAAMLLNGQRLRGERYLLSAEQDIERDESYYYSYASTIRDLAQTIVLLKELEKVIKLSPKMLALKNRLAVRVMQEAASRRYLSTQEKIALVKAGIALKQHSDEPIAFELIKDDKVQKVQAQSAGQLHLPVGTKLVNTGDKELFIQLVTEGLAVEEYMRSTLPHKQAQRIIRTESGSYYDGEALKVGDKLIVSLYISLEEAIPDGLVVEYLPTGFVLENPEYTNSAEIIEAADLTETSDWDMLEYRNDRLVASKPMRGDRQYRINYVLRAETPGVARLPAIFLEQMYQPENFIYRPESEFETITIKR